MRTRTLWQVAVVTALVTARPAHGVDAPHDQTFSSGQCDNCHTLHVTTTASGKKDFTPGCVFCHNQASTVAMTTLQFPWLEGVHQAVAGERGNQHNWSGYAQNPSRGARSPTWSAISGKLIDGKLQCAVCHDIHASSPTYAPGSKHVSFEVDAAVTSGTSHLTVVSTADASRAWRVQLATVAADKQSGTFIISHDFALETRTWLNWSGTDWVAGVSTGAGKPYTANAPVTLDDGVTRVKFAADGAVGAYWDFYVSYPFLRASNVSDAFCYQCHAERVMDHVRASGAEVTYAPDGKRKFSHPVSETLGANGKGYDRAFADVLDTDGSKQAAFDGVKYGDGIKSNNLKFDETNPATPVVRCTTCHATHNADSNSLTD